MPTRHGVEVTIITSDGQPFIEYGTKNLNRLNQKSRIVSTQIEAKTGRRFFVRIKPLVPFPFDSNERSDNTVLFDPMRTFDHCYALRSRRAEHNQPIEEEKDGSTKEAEFFHTNRELRPRTTNKTAPESGNSSAPNTSTVTTNANEPAHATSCDPLENETETPPFDLSAFVYIDGHEKPECRQIVYLDPKNPKYSAEGCILRGRWVSAQHGNQGADDAHLRERRSGQERIEIRNWIFASVGIDVLMSRMDMNAADPDVKTGMEREVDQLQNMMKESSMDTTQRPKPGQIEVRIVRICTGEMRGDQRFSAQQYAGSEEVGPGTAKIDAECTHTMSLESSGEQKVRLNTVSWRYYKKNEDVFARFMFQYMGREKLVKLGLCYEDGTPTLEGRIHASEEGRRTRSGTRRGVDDEEDGYAAALNVAKKVRPRASTRASEKGLEG